MMKIKRIFLILLLINVFNLKSQTDTVMLSVCHINALEKYPLKGEIENLKLISEYNYKNISSSHLPQINLNAQATLQSEVTDIPIHLPNLNIPELYKDMYKINLNISQNIYDGGSTKSKHKMEKISLSSQLNKIEIELYDLKQRVNKLYFSIILTKKNLELLKSQEEILNSRMNNVMSQVRNGTMIKANEDILKAELINLEQKKIELKNSLISYIDMLTELTGLTINENSVFILPAINIPINYENKRQEMELFDKQIQLLDENKHLISSKKNPFFYAFAESGYGRPGLNMLSNEFSFYYLAGLKVNWHFINWNNIKRENKIIELQKANINIAKNTFDKNLRIAIKSDVAMIKKYEELLIKNNENIKIRKDILQAYNSQLENGIITAQEYIAELNNLIQAEINFETNKVQLIYAKINYINNLGINY